MKQTAFETDQELGALGARLDVIIEALSGEDAIVAASDARRARLFAEAAEIADRRASLGSGSSASSRREWARRSTATEIACATRRSERTVTRMINDAEHLVHDFPSTLRALEEGRLSTLHTRHLIGHAITLPVEARPSYESRMLQLAFSTTARRFDDQARQERERVHPESIIARTLAARDERNVSLELGCDGMATLHHLLPAVEALAIDDLIDRIARSERASDDPRSHAQRRSDALAGLILQPGERPAITATVLVTVPAATVGGLSDDPGELHGYGVIDPSIARALAASAPTFLRVLTHPVTGEPTMVTRHRGQASDGGHERYSANPALRTVLAAADATCRFPGCTRRANRCELDHTRGWAEGGATAPENLAYFCSRHHHLKHEGGWSVTSDSERPRHLNWRSPRGRRYETRPAFPPNIGATPP